MFCTQCGANNADSATPLNLRLNWRLTALFPLFPCLSLQADRALRHSSQTP